MKHFKIKQSSIECFLLLTPFFEPQFLKSISIINQLYRFATYAVILYVFARIVITKRKISSNVLIIALLEGWMLLVTFVKHGLVNTALTNFVMFLGIAGVVYLFSKKSQILIKCLLLHFELCIYINLFTIYFMRNGLYLIATESYEHSAVGYFLGWHHLFVVWEIPALLVAWIYRSMYHKNLRCYLLSAAVFLSEIYFGGSTGLVGTILLLFLCMIPFFKDIFTPYKSIFVAIIILIVVVFSRTYSFLEPIIVGILNKDMTFTGRLVIWNNAINQIIRKPFIGQGIINQDILSKILGKRAATHCHDQILQILFQGGLIAFVLFVLLYIICIRNCKLLWKYKCAQVCIYAMISYTIIGITETFEYALMYLILILPFYLKEFCVIEEKTKKKKCQLEKQLDG